MNQGKLAVIILMMSMLLPFCSGTGTETTAKKNIQDYFKKFMTMETLEKAGFEHFDGVSFKLLSLNKNLYILNNKDYLIAKFMGDKLQRVFKTQKGQAPKELITPISFFVYDNDTLAIFDRTKYSVLLFDHDLNYLKEIKLKGQFERVDRVGKILVARLNVHAKNVFAILDNKFEIVKTIVKSNTKAPFDQFYPRLLNVAFFLGEELLAHSYWLFPYKKCHVNIHDLKGGLIVTLPWEQPFTPTAKSFEERKNWYGSNYIGKYGSYYVVKCSHSKTLLGSVRHHDLLIFDEKGTLKYRGDFPYIIRKVSENANDTKIFFMDDDEGISYIDVIDFI